MTTPDPQDLLGQHGPLATSLVFVCWVLYLFVTKVLPQVVATQSNALKDLVEQLKKSDENASFRHSAVIGKLETIDKKIDQLPKENHE